MIKVTETLSLDETDISLEFIQSSGPGGQNVNKVATAVQLRFDTHSACLSEDIRSRLFKIAHKRINEDGFLIIQARRYRSQEKNREDAIQRLVELVRNATEKPKPRHSTRPTRASIERRLEAKRKRAKVKQQRQLERHAPD